MDRRAFLRFFGMAAGGVLLDRAIPLGRVWSFPSKIRLATCADTMALQLEKVRDQIPMLYQGDPAFYALGIPYFQDSDPGVWMGIARDRRFDVSSRAVRIPLRFEELPKFEDMDTALDKLIK